MDDYSSPAPISGDQLPRAVIFDMDGVLLYSEPFIEQAITQMFSEKGLAIYKEDFIPFVGTGEGFCIKGIAAQYGFSLDVEGAKKEAYRIYYRLIRDNLKALPGAFDFIDKCRGLGKKLAIASSADMEKVRANSRAVGLDLGLFDAIVTGELVTNKKPSPDLFLLAAEKMGVEGSECLVIEDAINGIAAAHRAGSRCLALTTSFTADELIDAEWVTADLTAVDPQVLKW